MRRIDRFLDGLGALIAWVGNAFVMTLFYAIVFAASCVFARIVLEILELMRENGIPR